MADKRSALRSAVSLRVTALKRYLAEDDVAKVKIKVAELKESFSEFEVAHDEHHSSLKIDSEIIASNVYFEEVQNKYVDVLTSVKAFLKAAEMSPVTPPVTGAPPPCSQALRLPPAPQPQIFSGNPEGYPMWKASFATLIERRDLALSGEQKMFYLQKYTAGEAFEAIKSLFLIPSSESYDSAMNILKERFGTPNLVTSAFRKRLESWPKISSKEPKALQSFSDFLQQIKVAATQYDSLKILNDEFENKKLVSKLPHHISVKWVEHVVEKTDFPSFNDFAEFVKVRAKVSNHPLWDAHHSTSDKVKSLATRGQEGPKEDPKKDQPATKPQNCSYVPVCIICNNDNKHFVNRCPTFQKMSLAERKAAIMKHRLCFGCFSRSHQNSACRNKHTCEVCRMKHPTLLHDHSRSATTLSSATPSPGINSTMVVPVSISYQGRSKVVYALLDSQSTAHFISDEVLSSLKIPSTDTSLELTTMSGKRRVPTKVVEHIQVDSIEGSQSLTLNRCFSKSIIPCESGSIPSPDDVKRWPHLRDVSIPPGRHEIGLLIGYTCHQAFMPLKVITGTHNEPFAFKTQLGWCIMGPLKSPGEQLSTHISLNAKCKEIFLDEEDTALSIEDRQFLQILDEGVTQRSDGKLVAPLPLRSVPNLPNNRFMALQRLEGLKRKLDKNPGFKSKYAEVIKESLDSGFAEPVPPSDKGKVGSVWYIPHHGVPKDQDDVRVVFDCSADYKGNNLNGELLQGPNLINTLIGILLRFRSSPIGISCDIKKMYYNFFVNEEHRDLLRFLWWPDGDTSLSPADYRMTVHIFGSLSSGGVANYCLRKISEWYGESFPQQVKNFVEKDFYVDDGITSVNSTREALELFSETKSLLGKGGLVLHKVVSNSHEFLSSIPDSDKVDTAGDDVHKVLGLEWNTSLDTLHIPLPEKLAKLTKRGLLSVVASIFDPFGMVAPLSLQAKLLFQSVSDSSWDSPLPSEVSAKFQNWFENLKDFDVFIPRCHEPKFPVRLIQLHHFADASSIAYAACSFIRFVGFKNEVHVSFVIGKCKVIPPKPLHTIPRLELMACVLSTRLSQIIAKELPWRCQEFFWTDSNVVLGYIKNTTSRFKVFVANRIQTIHSRSQVDQWYHISSEDNPADDGSRAKQSARWLDGPDFLSLETLPVIPQECIQIALPDTCLSTDATPVLEVKPFKSWNSTKRVMAWVLRFINNCKARTVVREGPLQVQEMVQAEFQILKFAQHEHFGEEISALSSNNSVSPSSKLYKLDCFLDDRGLIRVGGRLEKASFSYEEKHPVVLSHDSSISVLIASNFHSKMHHQGRGMTVAEIRSSGYWILGLNKCVKNIIHRCLVCKRLRGKPVEQKMADLRECRLSPEPAFTNVGCDCFGPFTVRIGRSDVKRYGVIFTCLASRAVHIEMCYSMSSDSFVSAFQRFISLRGPVRSLHCDRGSNFVGARGELLKLDCDIIFNPPYSSHRGGVWERMIGVSRRVLEGILIEHGKQLDDEGLLTVLSETARVVNSRPLCPLENDDHSLEPLSPNLLLTMKSRIVSPLITTVTRADLYSSKRWKRVQYLANLFWSRWRKEFLTLYHQRKKWSKERPNICVGDIVLVMDEQVHRSFWKMARVIDTKLSLDGLVRSVQLILGDRSTIERSIQKLIFLCHSSVV